MTTLQEPRVEKIVLSIALGIHEPLHAKKVSDHLSRLLALGKPLRRTFCKNPVAKWKTRKGTPLGLMITLRKKEAKRVATLLNPERRYDGAHYDPGSSSLRAGLKTHRALGLERYDYSAPQYGLNYTVCLSYPGSRSWSRRIDPCQRRRRMVPQADARRVVARWAEDNA